MKLPEAFTNDSDLGLCYEKKVVMIGEAFFTQGIAAQVDIIHRLLQCMKESNEINKHDFPFYQLRVRPTNVYEHLTGPQGICFELRWGCREMLTPSTPEGEQ